MSRFFRNTFFLVVIIALVIVAPIGLQPAQAQSASGGCPAGTFSSGPDFVFNGDFFIGAGPGPGIDPAAGFTIGGNIYNAGDGNYPPDTSIAIQTGPINLFGGVAVNDPFPGDPAFGIPGVNTWLYVNGNNTGGPYIFWQQNITGLDENTTYNLFAYVNNVVVPASAAPIDPIPEFMINGVPSGIQFPVPEVPDEWVRIEMTFTTGPGQTSFTLALRDNAGGTFGDDLAITAIGVRACIQSSPSIEVVKTVSPTQANPGDTVTYTYVVTNTGNVTLDPVTLDDDQLGSITLPLTSLTPGQSTTVNVPYTIQPGDLPLTNIATVNGTHATGTASDTGTATVTTAPAPGISVTKSVTPLRADVGQTVTYTYIVTNTGNVPLNPVTLNDDQLGPITLPLTSLAPGQNTTVNVPYTIQAGDLPLTNIATAQGVPPAGGGVSATDSVTVRRLTVPEPEAPQVAQAPAVAIVDPFIMKSVQPPFAIPGEIVTWTITISNPGSIALSNVLMQDHMPVEVEILEGSATAGSVNFSGQTVTFNIDPLSPGQSVTISIRTRVRAVAVPFSISNQACVSAANTARPCAQATLVSVESLPATGESPWSAWRLPMLLAAVILLLFGGSRIFRQR